jgi:mannitol 2-dehydrogenase
VERWLHVLPVHVSREPPALNRIVHFGVGNFHRAHQAVYLDELADPDWTICGAGVMPQDAAMRDALVANDFEYDVVLGGERRTIRSIRDFVLDPDDIIERLADAATRIVSLTITEAGYVNWSPVFVLLTLALRRRRLAGLPAFTVLSCDNLESNGDVARAALGYIEGVTFPNSMVDRITPATPSAAAPVVAEAFSQWVIEDRFCNGRPPLERVGVQFVDDVRPYELMKIRLLNGGHQVVARLGDQRGYEFIHDAVGDAAIESTLREYWVSEAVPTLAPIDGVDFGAYCDTLVERFSNASIADTVARVKNVQDAVDAFLTPVIDANRARGRAAPIAESVSRL